MHFVVSWPAWSQDLISASTFPGIHAKAGSGAGLTISRGPGAIFLNPANIIFSRFLSPEADLGFSMTNYRYQHTDSDKYGTALASLTTIQMTLGATFRPIPPLALSAAFVPLGIGSKYTVESVPFLVGEGVYEPSFMEVSQSGQIFAGGAAYKVHPLLTLGAGASMTSENFTILATKDAEDEPYFDSKYGGSYLQFVLGSRVDLFKQKVSLAFSYKSAATKKYQGDYFLDTTNNSRSDYVAQDYLGYAPASIGLGGEFQTGIFGLYGDFRLHQWSAGVADKGIAPLPAATALSDNFEVTGGGKFWLQKDHMLMGGFGFVTPNVGDGTELADETTEPVEGMGFASLEGIQRLIFSGGYRYRIQNSGYLMVGGQYQTGSRSVPEGFSYEGSHSMSVLMGSIGGTYGF